MLDGLQVVHSLFQIWNPLFSQGLRPTSGTNAKFKDSSLLIRPSCPSTLLCQITYVQRISNHIKTRKLPMPDLLALLFEGCHICIYSLCIISTIWKKIIPSKYKTIQLTRLKEVYHVWNLQNWPIFLKVSE